MVAIDNSSFLSKQDENKTETYLCHCYVLAVVNNKTHREMVNAIFLKVPMNNSYFLQSRTRPKQKRINEAIRDINEYVSDDFNNIIKGKVLNLVMQLKTSQLSLQGR